MSFFPDRNSGDPSINHSQSLGRLLPQPLMSSIEIERRKRFQGRRIFLLITTTLALFAVMLRGPVFVQLKRDRKVLSLISQILKELFMLSLLDMP